MRVVGNRPEATPHRSAARSKTVFGCAPARLNCPVSLGSRQDAVSQRLATIPGVGLIGATALYASVADPRLFRSGREFDAYVQF